MRINRTEALPDKGCSRVFIPSLPTRWDPATSTRKTIYDLSKAEPFGVLFSLSLDAQDEQEALNSIEEGMRDFCSADFILAIGDITRILAALIAAKERLGSARLLQWDKRAQRYIITEVIF